MSKFWVIYISNFYRPPSRLNSRRDMRKNSVVARCPDFFIFVDTADSVLTGKKIGQVIVITIIFLYFCKS